MQENSSHSSQLEGQAVCWSLPVLCDTELSQFNALAQRIPPFSFDIGWNIDA